MRLFRMMTLRQRIILLVTVGMAAILGGFSLLGISAVKESTDRTLAERLMVAQLAASYLDLMLEQSLQQLENCYSLNFTAIREEPEQKHRILNDIYRRLAIPVSYVSYIDRKGIVVATEPNTPGVLESNLGGILRVQEALRTGKSSIVSDPSLTSKERLLVYFTVSTKGSGGDVEGLLEAAVDLTDPRISSRIRQLAPGETGNTQIIDSGGVAIASTLEEHLFLKSDHDAWFTTLIKEKKTSVATCHDCHKGSSSLERRKDILAFAPLSVVPWGVAIRQSEEEALAPTRDLQQRLLILGSISFLAVLGVALLLTQGVVAPVKALTIAAQRLAQGNLSDPVPISGEAEIGVLARSLDTMRAKLKESLEELERKEEARGQLLSQVISAQEDERKRIARELHDETSQALTTLVLNLDTLAMSPVKASKLRERLKGIRSVAVSTLEGIHKLIYDLRPAMLDDLGLLAAIRWYAESRLESAGVEVHLETAGNERRLPPQVETSLFRITQEAIANLAQHAQAESASITVEFGEDYVTVQIEDDGKGFDVTEIFHRYEADGRGLGLLGMEERVSLLGGKLVIKSHPGGGTQIVAQVPLVGGVSHEQDTSANSR